MNLLLVVELEFGNTFEALLQVWLHSQWLLSLGQDFEKLIVRQEVESGEQGSLGLQVVVKTFGDSLELFIGLFEGWS